MPQLQGAAKLCQQALTKYPGYPLFLVLKAIAFDRTGDVAKAEPLLQQAIDSDACCEEARHHAATLLQHNGDFEMLLDMYEKAAARAPGDIALQQQLFCAHARLVQPVKQQQVAMRLNKSEPCELHAFWHVASVLAQAALRRRGPHLRIFCTFLRMLL